MGFRHDYPEFSNIRSHIERSEAQHSFEVGYAIADTLMVAGDYLRRAVATLISALRWVLQPSRH